MEENVQETQFCQFCGKEIAAESIVCPNCGRQLKLLKVDDPQPVATEANKSSNNVLVVFGIIFIFFLFTMIIVRSYVNINDKDDENAADVIDENDSDKDDSDKDEIETVKVIDFTNMRESSALLWCKNNDLDCTANWEYSDTIAKGDFIRQSVSPNQVVEENTHITITYSYGVEPADPTIDENTVE